MKREEHARAAGATEAALIKFGYNGDEHHLVRLPDGDIGVVFRRLCETVPVDYVGQAQRLSRFEALGVRWAALCAVHVVAADGKVREMKILPRRSIAMWAATIDLARVTPEAQAKLVPMHDDFAAVLAREFVDRVAEDGRVQDLSEQLHETLGALRETTGELHELRAAVERGEGADPLKVLVAGAAEAIAVGDLSRAAQLHAALGCLLPRPMTSATRIADTPRGWGRGEDADDETLRQTLQKNPGVSNLDHLREIAGMNAGRASKAIQRLRAAGEIENRGDRPRKPRYFWRDPKASAN